MPCIGEKVLKIGSLGIMKNSIWFLLAAVVSLHGMAFAEDDNSEPSGTEIVSQEQEKQDKDPIEQFSERK